MKWVGHVACLGDRRGLHVGLWWGNLREGDPLENLGIGGRIMLKWIFKMWDGGLNWIHMAQNRDRWLAVMNVIMNFQVP
jgi:hypothetical protein